MKTVYVIQHEGNPISIAYDKLDIINILNDYTKGTMIQFIPAKTIADNLNGTCLYGTYYYLSDAMSQTAFKVYEVKTE